MTNPSTTATSAGAEFNKLDVGDVRVSARAILSTDLLSAAPELSFPQALGSDAACEAFYRLLSNRRVHYGLLVKSHAESAIERMPAGQDVLVLHDTTEFAFSNENGSREGLGHTRSSTSKSGFLSHVSFAVTPHGEPLGTLAMTNWVRKQLRKRKRKMSGSDLAGIKDKESARWGTQINKVESIVGDRASLIHVMDREADAYPLLCSMVEMRQRFVTRMARDRKVFPMEADGEPSDEELLMSEAVMDLPVVLTREVPLGTRQAPKTLPRSAKAHPDREARIATLTVSSGRVAFRRPRYSGQNLPEDLELNIVQVIELNPPEGVAPVSWVLLTSEQVSTSAEIEKVIDTYRARWLIEEFFKALKTGCKYESCQLESFQTLTNALGLMLPIAWQMLLLRWKSRTNPTAPAETVLTPVQITLLRARGQKLPAKNPTVLDALYAVAGLGGHFKHNGPPGWLTLTRGMTALATLEQGWRAASAIKSRTS